MRMRTNSAHDALTLSILLLLLSNPAAGGGKCGTALYEACSLGTVDPRYNPDVSFNLSTSHPLYAEWSGYWIGTAESFAPDGQPRQPSPFDPATKRGLPYGLNKPFLTFVNKTIIGTRLHWHIAAIYDPADATFCESDIPEGLTNVIGNGTCGINGHAAAIDVLGTSTYEKDGTADIFWWTNGQGTGPAILENSFLKPVNDYTMFISAGLPSQLLWSHTQQITNSGGNRLSGSASFVQFVDGGDDEGISWHMNYKQRKVPEEEWLEELSQAYANSNVLADERLTIPLEGPCLRTWDCPIESSTWCEAGDPNVEACPDNISPYVEPDVPMKPGAVAGFTILGLMVGAVLGYFAWRHAMRKKKARYQRLFVHRIAKEIKFNPTGSIKSSEEDLIQAFKKIDVSEDGYIEKEELRAFLSSESMTGSGTIDKAIISDSDLNALFAALDPNGRGKVNFLDFCTFLSECDANGVSAADDIDREMKECDDEERMGRIAKRLSSRQLLSKK